MISTQKSEVSFPDYPRSGKAAKDSEYLVANGLRGNGRGVRILGLFRGKNSSNAHL